MSSVLDLSFLSVKPRRTHSEEEEDDDDDEEDEEEDEEEALGKQDPTTFNDMERSDYVQDIPVSHCTSNTVSIMAPSTY